MATKESEQMTIHKVLLCTVPILLYPFSQQLPVYYMALYWQEVFILLSINGSHFMTYIVFTFS